MNQTLTNNIHIPVLANEVIKNLQIKANGTYVDCTAGFGGHSQLILNKLKSGKLICIDQDKDAINSLNSLFKNKKNIVIVHDNFKNLDNIVNGKVDGIIIDLGVSSFMLNNPKRGFSYKNDGPLDMRMDQNNKLTASWIVNNYTPSQLTNIFLNYGEVKNVKQVVKKIEQYRKTKSINSTIELSNLICSCFKRCFFAKHPAKKYFQALRIETNDELNILKKVLKISTKLLNKNGRLVIISFHSLEDRIVKHFFKDITETHDLYDKSVSISKYLIPNFKLITKKPITPSLNEILKNNRCHSAKLRVVERV